MTWFEVEHPFQERAGLFEPLFDLDVAESVLREVAKEASEDDESFSAQRPVPPVGSAGECLVVRVDGKGVPMLRAEAVTLKATLGTGKTRHQKQEALVGGSATVDPQPRSPEVLAELLIAPEAARARRQRQESTDESPRAQQGRRLASLGRTKQAVIVGLKADAERREPQHRTPLGVRLDGALGLWHVATKLFKEWRRVPCVLDIMPVVGDLWSAANAWCGEEAPQGNRWVRAKLTAMLRGRGDISSAAATHPHQTAAANVGAGDARARHHVLP